VTALGSLRTIVQVKYRPILSSEMVLNIRKPTIVGQKRKIWSLVPVGSPTPRHWPTDRRSQLKFRLPFACAAEGELSGRENCDVIGGPRVYDGKHVSSWTGIRTRGQMLCGNVCRISCITLQSSSAID
jgi:hypothetical protein